MAFDGIVTAAVVAELKKTILGGKITRAQQPERDDIVLTVYNDGKSYRVLLSANPQYVRMHLTEINRENPLTAPAFCMAMRKHLIGSTITDIIQTDFDRIVTFVVEGFSDMGDRYVDRLVVEAMRYSNIILVNENNVIIDAVRHVDNDTCAFREVLPARKYIAPPPQDRVLPLPGAEYTMPTEPFEIPAYLMSHFSGFSKPVSRAIKNAADLETVLKDIQDGNFVPFVTDDLSDYHVLNIVKNSYENCREFTSVSAALECYYHGKEVQAHAKNVKAGTTKIVANNIDRVTKKIRIFESDMRDAEDYDKYRIIGDVLAANIYKLNGGETVIRCQNFYDENLADVDIVLDPHKTPASNLQNYYRLYRKNKSKVDNCLVNIEKAESELMYLLSVKDALDKAVETPDIEQIKYELQEGGYTKKTVDKFRKRPSSIKVENYLVFKVSDGYEAWVGKNNIQNDKLTLKLANGNDLWFHVKNSPGSHVILRTSLTGGEYTNAAIMDAAKLAAMHSSLSEAHVATVDFTKVKYVKKPAGSRPGMVIYTGEKSINLEF